MMRRGFTMLELLMAIVLLGGITAVTAMTFSVITNGWQTSTEYMDKMQRADYGLDQVVSALRSLYYPHDGEQSYDYGFILQDNGEGDDPDSSDVIEWSKMGAAIVGNKNAIAALADMIHDIYAIELPVRENSRVTLNVGIVEGGTSVNTIAQNARMLCEYRSDNADCIDIMKEKFHEIFENAKTDEVKVNVTPVGERPCARGVSEDDLQALIADCSAVIEEVDGRAPIYASGSTDCNIPLSLGVPAIIGASKVVLTAISATRPLGVSR